MMKLFWQIVTSLYVQLQDLGVNLSRPKWLFHQPKTKLPCKLRGTILGDASFTANERLYILESLDNLHYFCNGLVELEIIFELNSEDEDTIKNNCVILRVPPTHPEITKAYDVFGKPLLGLCVYRETSHRHLYLIPDNYSGPVTFKSVALHELLHLIWLGHTEKSSVMHEFNNNLLHPNLIDAEELVKVWSTCTPISIEDVRYFRRPVV